MRRRLRVGIATVLATLLCGRTAGHAAPLCAGDCDGDHATTVNELVRGVAISLGNAPLSDCPVFDANADGQVVINELISGVRATLDGCPTPVASMTPSPVPTATPTPTPTPDLGPPSVARLMASSAAATTASLIVVPEILSALLGHLPASLSGTGGGAVCGFPLGLRCDNQIGGSLVCCQGETIPPPPPTYALEFTDCRVDTGGAQISFDGLINATGQAGTTCGVGIPAETTVTVPSLQITKTGAAGKLVATYSNLAGAVSLSGSHPVCTYTTAQFRVTGQLTVDAQAPDGTRLATTGIEFGPSNEVTIEAREFGPRCVPLVYRITAHGPFALSFGGPALPITLEDYVLENDKTFGDNDVRFSGRLASSCLGYWVDLAAPDALRIVEGALCPQSGAVEVRFETNADRVRYSDTGGVMIDYGGNGSDEESFANCQSAALRQCPRP